MRADELRELSADDLQAKQTELREQLFKLRFQKAIGQLDNEKKLGETRREIARVLTVLKEKQA
jgi:large subunit ribosomal protein L29